MINISEYLLGRIPCILEANAGSPVSDSAILFKIGEHKFKWMSHFRDARDRAVNKYDIRGSHYRAGIIQFAKDKFVKLLKNSQELIPRDEWDLDGLIGETEYQLMHPHYWTFNDWIMDTHKAKRKVLTIFECSNAKPYSVQKNRQNFYCQWYKAFTDMACMSNPGIVPLEYSHFYPYRYDEWNHFDESEDIANKYTWVCISRMLDYKKKMGYTDVVVVMQSRHPQKWAEKMYNENIGGAKKWIHIVNDEAHADDFIKRSERIFGKTGIKIQRLIQQDFFIDRYVRLLRDCLSESDSKELDKLLEIKKIKSKTERREKLAEFNERHGVEPYDILSGTDANKDVYKEDRGSASQEDISYIKGRLKTAVEEFDKAKEEEEWHKYRSVFTVLDLLMDKNEGKIIENVDKAYWDMYAATQKVVADNSNYHQLNNYCFCLESLIQEIGIKEVKKYCNKHGITQFNDERRRHPDK